jgi:hypothetical protein
MKAGVAVVDVITGLHAAIGILPPCGIGRGPVTASGSR